MRCARYVRTIVVTLALVVATPAAAQEGAPLAPDESVTIRLYDYAAIPPTVIVRAERIVTQAFASIGVHIHWAATISAWDLDAGLGSMVDPQQERIVIIMNHAMEKRAAFRSDVIGVATNTPTENGRIAYVLSNRVQRVASESGRDEMEVMGLVMAHEVGHLLLPHGSHSPTGLMQPQWKVNELRTDRSFPTFTGTQAEVMRRSLAR